MSNIVVLDSRRDIRRQRTLPAGGATGVILLFTGVRYQRDGDPAPPANAAAARQSPRGKRRRRS
jgi:hypothetical protein